MRGGARSKWQVKNFCQHRPHHQAAALTVAGVPGGLHDRRGARPCATSRCSSDRPSSSLFPISRPVSPTPSRLRRAHVRGRAHSGGESSSTAQRRVFLARKPKQGRAEGQRRWRPLQRIWLRSGRLLQHTRQHQRCLSLATIRLPWTPPAPHGTSGPAPPDKMST